MDLQTNLRPRNLKIASVNEGAFSQDVRQKLVILEQ